MAASPNFSSRQGMLPLSTPCRSGCFPGHRKNSYVASWLFPPIGAQSIQYLHSRHSTRLQPASDVILEQTISSIYDSTDLYSPSALLKAVPMRRAMLQTPVSTSEPVPALVRTVQTWDPSRMVHIPQPTHSQPMLAQAGVATAASGGCSSSITMCKRWAAICYVQRCSPISPVTMVY